MCLVVTVRISPADAVEVAKFISRAPLARVKFGSNQKREAPTSYEIYPDDNCACVFMAGGLNELRWRLTAEARSIFATVVREIDSRTTRPWRFSVLWFADEPSGESSCFAADLEKEILADRLSKDVHLVRPRRGRRVGPAA